MKYNHDQKRLTIKHRSHFGNRSARIDANQIMQATYCTRATAYRWIEDPDKIPEGYVELLEIKVLGLIPDPAFSGWSVDDGKLISPLAKNEGLTPGTLDNITWLARLVRWQKTSIDKLGQREKALNRMLNDYRKKLSLPVAANDE